MPSIISRKKSRKGPRKNRVAEKAFIHEKASDHGSITSLSTNGTSNSKRSKVSLGKIRLVKSSRARKSSSSSVSTVETFRPSASSFGDDDANSSSGCCTAIDEEDASRVWATLGGGDTATCAPSRSPARRSFHDEEELEEASLPDRCGELALMEDEDVNTILDDGTGWDDVVFPSSPLAKDRPDNSMLSKEAELSYKAGRDAFSSQQLGDACQYQLRALEALKAEAAKERMVTLHLLRAGCSLTLSEGGWQRYLPDAPAAAAVLLETKIRLELAKIRILQSFERTTTSHHNNSRRAKLRESGAKFYLSCILRTLPILDLSDECLRDVPLGLVVVLSEAGRMHCTTIQGMGVGVLYHRAALHLARGALFAHNQGATFCGNGVAEESQNLFATTADGTETAACDWLGGLCYTLGVTTLLHAKSLGNMKPFEGGALQGEGIEHLKEAVLFQRNSSHGDNSKALIRTLESLGSAQCCQGDVQGSAESRREVVQLLKQRRSRQQHAKHERHDSKADEGCELAGALHNLAKVLVDLDDVTEALLVLIEALEILQVHSVEGDDDENGDWFGDEMRGTSEMDDINDMNLFIIEQEADHTPVKENGNKGIATTHTFSACNDLQLSCLRLAAQIQSENFSLMSSAKTYLRILKLQYKTLGRAHRDTADTWRCYGKVLFEAQRYRHAALCFEEEVEIRRSAAIEGEEGKEEVVRSLLDLSRLYEAKLGELETAEMFYDEATRVNKGGISAQSLRQAARSKGRSIGSWDDDDSTAEAGGRGSPRSVVVEASGH